MAHTKSAIKRLRTSRQANLRNRMRTSVKSRAFMVGFTLRIGNLKPSQKKVAASSTDIRDREDSSLPLNSIMMTGGEGGN